MDERDLEQRLARAPLVAEPRQERTRAAVVVHRLGGRPQRPGVGRRRRSARRRPRRACPPRRGGGRAPAPAGSCWPRGPAPAAPRRCDGEPRGGRARAGWHRRPPAPARAGTGTRATGRRRSSVIRSSRCSSSTAECATSAPTSFSKSSMPNARPTAALSVATSRAAGLSRPSRACKAVCTATGTDTSARSTRSSSPSDPVAITSRSTRSRIASSMKKGLPPDRSVTSSATSGGSERARHRLGQPGAGIGGERPQLDLAVAMREAVRGHAGRASRRSTRARCDIPARIRPRPARSGRADRRRPRWWPRRPSAGRPSPPARGAAGPGSRAPRRRPRRPVRGRSRGTARSAPAPTPAPSGARPERRRQEYVALAQLAEQLASGGPSARVACATRWRQPADPSSRAAGRAPATAGSPVAYDELRPSSSSGGFGRGGHHLADQPGLADPGLAGDHHDHAQPVAQLGHRPLQQRALEVAAHQRRLGTRVAGQARRCPRAAAAPAG